VGIYEKSTAQGLSDHLFMKLKFGTAGIFLFKHMKFELKGAAVIAFLESKL
jgi:hypothetical protein